MCAEAAVCQYSRNQGPVFDKLAEHVAAKARGLPVELVALTELRTPFEKRWKLLCVAWKQ
jgi:hypothetical protein